MPTPKPKQSSFGGANLARVGPFPAHGLPQTMNLTLSFEETLKLHLALGQVLAKLNGYNRATRAGRQSATVLAVYPYKKRAFVREGRLPPDGQVASIEEDNDGEA
jgi:hypothetical protein